jgi:hypothetical protein
VFGSIPSGGKLWQCEQFLVSDSTHVCPAVILYRRYGCTSIFVHTRIQFFGGMGTILKKERGFQKRDLLLEKRIPGRIQNTLTI